MYLSGEIISRPVVAFLCGLGGCARCDGCTVDQVGCAWKMFFYFLWRRYFHWSGFCVVILGRLAWVSGGYMGTTVVVGRTAGKLNLLLGHR